MIRLLTGLGVLGLGLVLGGYVYLTYWHSPSEGSQVQGGTTAWDARVSLGPEERYFYLRSSQPLTKQKRSKLRATYGISFIERLPGFGYVIKRPATMGVTQLTRLDDTAHLSLHRISAANRLSSGLKPARGTFTPDLLRKLGSLDAATVPVLVSFRQDADITAQRDLLRGLISSGLPVRRTGPDNQPVWRLQLTPSELTALAMDETVRWIEPAGSRPQTDLGEAVPGVGGIGFPEKGAGVLIGQVEPCAALTKHLGFSTGRMIADAEPEPLCAPVLAELSTFVSHPGFDDSTYDPAWPLWLDTDGDKQGDVCVWDGSDAPCTSNNAPTDARWHWIKLDTFRSPHFPRYIHRENEEKGTLHHFRLCSNLPQETLPGCVQPAGTGTGFWPQSISPGDPFIGAELMAFSPVAHATHVAGIMIGNGSEAPDVDTPFDPPSIGMAPEARIRGFTVGMEGSQAYLAYSNLMLHDIQVVNNSWGLEHGFSPVPANFWLARYYDALSSGRLSDGSSTNWDHSVLIVGSAGNSGQFPGTNVERWQSARLGNSSKNSIAVANLSKDKLLVADSSRGPTKDGRITPLISAIGGDSSQKNVSDIRSIYPYGYGRFYGTSQAAPLVAATAAMVAKTQTDICGSTLGFAGGTTPGKVVPALVRGILLHTAKRIDNSDPEGPDFRTGFGILDALNALQFARDTKFQSHTIGTGYVEYSVDVTSSALELQDLRVTLTWDDPPWPAVLAPSDRQGLLQTDLDLELLGPDGRRYLPWMLDPGHPESAAQAHHLHIFRPVPVAYRDHRNTVEQVVVKNAPTGVWRFRVRSNHPFGADVVPQPFTLVSGAFGGGTCSALPPRVVENAIWLSSDPFRWYLFWLALLVILLLLLIAWLELRDPPVPVQGDPLEVPPLLVTLLRFALFVFMLILIFLALYYSAFGLSFWGLGLALLIGLTLYLTAP